MSHVSICILPSHLHTDGKITNQDLETIPQYYLFTQDAALVATFRGSVQYQWSTQ